MTKDKKPYKLGIALSGGGMRAFSHLGVLKALMEMGIKPDIIAGTSMGAIVGALFADGHNPEDILREAFEYHFKKHKFISSKLSTEGVMTLSGVEAFLKNKLTVKTIEKLSIPLVVAVSNLDKAKIEYLTKGNLIQAVIASSSIPILFPPVKIEKYRYVDGGVLNNLPVKPIRSLCKFVIGVDSNPIPVDTHATCKRINQIAERCFYLAIQANTLEDREQCDFFIEPEGLEKFGMLDFKKMNDTFDLGYQKTMQLLQKDAELLINIE